MLGLHVLDLRLLKFEKAVTFPAVAVDPVGIEILFVLLQGRLSGTIAHNEYNTTLDDCGPKWRG